MYKNLQKNYKNPVKKVVVRRMGIARNSCSQPLIQIISGKLMFAAADPDN